MIARYLKYFHLLLCKIIDEKRIQMVVLTPKINYKSFKSVIPLRK